MDWSYLAAVSMAFAVGVTFGFQCQSDEFTCADGLKCIKASNFCDGNRDCRDGSDEPPLRNVNIKYVANETFCRGKRRGHICVIQSDLEERLGKYCEDGFICKDEEFSCADGSRCIQASQFCDGYPQCRDMSDEPSPGVRRFTYNETASTCQSIHTGWICNSTKLDPRKIDYCKQHYLGKYMFRCLLNDDITIRISKVCNGVFDCPDWSDECLCSSSTRPERCKNGIPPRNGKYSELMKNSPDGIKINTYECPRTRKELMKNSQVGITINTYECPRTRKDATNCDGGPEYPYFWHEECDFNINPEFCRHLKLSRHPRLSSDDGSGEVHDGVLESAAFSSDSVNMHDCSASRFYCTDDPFPNIPLHQICDGTENCLNGADEGNGTFFCCRDKGNLDYIPRSKVCDGFQDCNSGLDECQNCIVSAFSNDSSLISSALPMGLVELISIFIVMFGCVAVIVITTLDELLKYLKAGGAEMNANGHKITMKISIINLSIADILVLVHTFQISEKAQKFTEGYCLYDRSWRSSSTCSAFGAIFMIGSEQSVFTMVLIAAQRLYAVMRPFSTPKPHRAIILALAPWVISIALGLIPLIRPLEDYFVSSIMFNDNQIFKTMDNNETDYMISWLSLLHQNSTIGNDFEGTNWSKIRNLTAKINPNIEVKYEFGYYSSHTVCLPTFFPDQSKDTAWGYTLLILLINSIAFLFVAICHILLYRDATRSRSMGQPQQQMRDNMQRKLTRIVVFNLVCWMPICIMGFLQIAGIDMKDGYLPAGLLIIPIKSGLTPLLYSPIPGFLIEKFELLRRRFCQRAAIQPEYIEMTSI